MEHELHVARWWNGFALFCSCSEAYGRTVAEFEKLETVSLDTLTRLAHEHITEAEAA